MNPGWTISTRRPRRRGAGISAGLPPAWIGVGTLDLFHDEDLAYAESLRSAGVACATHVVPGAFHGFDALANTDVARDFRASQVRALREAFDL